MISPLPKYLRRGVVVLVAMLSCVLPAISGDTPANDYKETGAVLSVVSKHGHYYQVSTDDRIYLLLCDKVRDFQFGMPECKIDGKPIAVGDTLHFRIDGDWAYLPPVSQGMEEKLRILTTELKVIPTLPPATPNSNGAGAGSEPGVVIGSGMHMKGQGAVGWSTAPAAVSGITTASAATPVMPSGPVTAVPVTGGAPVVVMPTGPTTGGVVTGVPVTGGAPITAIPTGPVMGAPVGGAPGGVVMAGGSRPQWVHVLRIQSAGKIYQLECSSKPCMLDQRDIALADKLVIRVDKKHVYLSSGPQGPEAQYKLLGVTDAASGSSKPDNPPQAGDKKT